MIEVERSFSATDVRQVQVAIGLGDITARANGHGQIRVRARIRSGDETELETAVVEGLLKIGQRKLGDGPRAASAMDITLILPAGCEAPVSAATGKGDASFSGVNGPCEIQTGKGDVSASALAGGLIVQTGMGDVSVHDSRGALRVETGKGDVSIEALAGGLQVRTGAGDVSVRNWQTAAVGGVKHAIRTGSGDVSLDQGQAQAIEVHTGRGDCSFHRVAIADLQVHSGSGDVALDGDPASSRWDLRTGKGDLSIEIPACAVRIEASTRHGDISSDLAQIKVARPGPASQRGGRSIGVMGDEPRAEILLDTGHGDISIRVVGVAPPASPSKDWAAALVQPAPSAAMLQTISPAEAVQENPRTTALAILESLARGEISVDEAEALLRSLAPA